MTETRFQEKITKSESCWLWTAARNRAGYGLFRFNRRPELAHRVAYELEYGQFPKELCVLHRCDTPACVRPDHLFLGTILDNNRDRDAKNRQAKGDRIGLRVRPMDRAGEKNGRAKLTLDAVATIRRLASQGLGATALARQFGVSPSAIRFAVRGETWPS